MSDHGLKAELDRALSQNERLRRDRKKDIAQRMGLTRGETMLLVERYKPEIGADPTVWSETAVRRWLHGQYAGAVYIEGEEA